MITIANTSGELVLSKEENGYAEVLENFQDASSITIVTYNIYAYRDDLLSKLHQLGSDKEVMVITKVPSRWEYYRNIYKKEEALKQMEQYCSRLDPGN